MDNWSAHKKAVEILEDDGVMEVWDEDTDRSEDDIDETAPSGTAAYFPIYAPELNPAEYVWSYSKYSDLVNHTPKMLDVLQRRVGQSLLAIPDNQELLREFVTYFGLELGFESYQSI